MHFIRTIIVALLGTCSNAPWDVEKNGINPGFAFPRLLSSECHPHSFGSWCHLHGDQKHNHTTVKHHHTPTQVDTCYGSNPDPFKHRTISKPVSVWQEYRPRTLLPIDHNYSFHRCHVEPLQPLHNSGHGVSSQSQSQLPSHSSTATSRGRPGSCPVRGTRPVSSALPSTTPQHSRLADYHSTYGFPNPPRHTPLTFPWHNFRNNRVIPPKHQDL